VSGVVVVVLVGFRPLRERYRDKKDVSKYVRMY